MYVGNREREHVLWNWLILIVKLGKSSNRFSTCNHWKLWFFNIVFLCKLYGYLCFICNYHILRSVFQHNRPFGENMNWIYTWIQVAILQSKRSQWLSLRHSMCVASINPNSLMIRMLISNKRDFLFREDAEADDGISSKVKSHSDKWSMIFQTTSLKSCGFSFLLCRICCQRITEVKQRSSERR